jgi:anti-sigma factor RsiW
MTCPDEDTLLQLALGELTVNESRTVEEHAARCAHCRARTATIGRLVADLGAPPSSESADDAFVARVSAAAAARDPVVAVRPRRAPVIALTAAALLLVGPAVWWVRRDVATSAGDLRGTVTARGKAGPVLAAEVLLARQGALSSVDGQSLGGADALAVRVTNTSARTLHLMAFAEDDAGEVHWLYPPYPDARLDPAAVPIAPGTRGQLLPEMVQPDRPAPGPMRLVTVLAPAPLTVKGVERALAEHRGADRQGLFPGATVTTWSARWRSLP